MCEAPNNPPIRGGEFSNLFHGSAPRNADVVLVAQQSSCIGDFDFKTMLHLNHNLCMFVSVDTFMKRRISHYPNRVFSVTS